jgi:hypothetical protein
MALTPLVLEQPGANAIQPAPGTGCGFGVKKRRPSRLEAAQLVSDTVRLFIVLCLLSLVDIGAALARSWSYHYVPRTPKPSPEAAATPASARAEKLSTARLLKQAIVSDLAIFTQERVGSDMAPTDHSEYVVSRLALFDPMGSPEALGVLASLSGYYLGARGEKLYDCLALRKGKALEPLLEQYLHNGNPECLRELGQSFAKPSNALDGYALCLTDQQQRDHLTRVIAEIDTAKPCPDSEFASIVNAQHVSSGAQ